MSSWRTCSSPVRLVIRGGNRGNPIVVVPDAGHMAPLENPAAFNAALEKFLARS